MTSSSILLIRFIIHFPGAEKQAEIVEESIKHAREAIALDVRDGNSWCEFLL